MRSPRPWLQSEVDILVRQYIAKDMTGVYDTIERMFVLDRDGAITITRHEAAQCAAALYTEDSLWGLTPENRALADRLQVAP